MRNQSLQKASRKLTPEEERQAETTLRKIVNDPLRLAGDSEFASFATAQFQNVFGTNPVERDETGRTIPPRAKSARIDPFQPSVTREDLNISGPIDATSVRAMNAFEEGVLEGFVSGARPGRSARRSESNDPADVLKLQKALSNTGDFSFDLSSESSGELTKRLTRAIRNFQKRNGLEVDGLVKPDGPTIHAMEHALFQPDGTRREDASDKERFGALQIPEETRALNLVPARRNPLRRIELDRSAVAASRKGTRKPQNSKTKRVEDSANANLNRVRQERTAIDSNSKLRTGQDFVSELSKRLRENGTARNHKPTSILLSLAGGEQDSNPQTELDLAPQVNRAIRLAAVRSALDGVPFDEHTIASALQNVAQVASPDRGDIQRLLVDRAFSDDASPEERANALGFLAILRDSKRGAVARGDSDPEASAERSLSDFIGYLAGKPMWSADSYAATVLPVVQPAGEEGQKVKKPRGMHNPRTREAVKEGQRRHREFKERHKHKEQNVYKNGARWQFEKTIKGDGQTVRPDAVTPRERIIELKPDTPSGRDTARKQCARYTRVTGMKCRAIFYKPSTSTDSGEEKPKGDRMDKRESPNKKAKTSKRQQRSDGKVTGRQTRGGSSRGGGPGGGDFPFRRLKNLGHRRNRLVR